MSNDLRNLLITILLSTFILVGWQYFYESPRLAKLEVEQEKKRDKVLSEKKDSAQILKKRDDLNSNTIQDKSFPKLLIESKMIQGYINLAGAKFENIILNGYYQSLDHSKGEITLFNSEPKNRYFAEFSWLSSDKELHLPSTDTVWHSDQKVLRPDSPVTLHFRNKQNIDFYLKIELDEQYLFKITQIVKNSSNEKINISPYGLINRRLPKIPENLFVMHEGPIGGLNRSLKEINYVDLAKQKSKDFKNNYGGWLGITDKYWLSAIIIDKKHNFNASFDYYQNDDENVYQTDFVSENHNVSAGKEMEFTSYLFTGPKKSEIINNYQSKYDIDLFDRSIDYGWFYFITKPMFSLLQFLFSWSGNFGVAIILLTLLIKCLMFPMANKSYRSMQRIKVLQPQINHLRELYSNDKVKMNSELMELYKKEKVNPVSGCLPMFIQIPVFFSLYKVIFVALEMRQAPFFGWIKDLSAPDPTSVFNLFGLISWNPPLFLQIGVWPLIMGITMFLQQQLNPPPADPTQATVMKFLPLIFVVMFHNFPAGLMIYWSFSNTISILQQWLITYPVKQKSKNG